jgi:hypothetical protein
MFKFKITIDSHNAGQKLIYCLFPDPPHFSLPSTLKISSHMKKVTIMDVGIASYYQSNANKFGKIFHVSYVQLC